MRTTTPVTGEGAGRHPADVIDPATGKVRVLAHRCGTCIFYREVSERLAGRAEEIIRENVARNALLTCHATLPYGDHPDFGPAVCAGFWGKHGMQTAAGRIARLIGIIRVPPPRDGAP